MVKKPTNPNPNVTEANDVLETAEMLRAATTLLRTTVGMVALSTPLCKAEVFSKSELEDINNAYTLLFDKFRVLYASLMGRYSALSSSDSVGSPKNVPVNN